ncbi:MAG: HAMP domain-containing histidine kinase [Eubacterium sp.]|nr:HAMP domain-containing histidine kinase [Eubacterium sp.]
MTERVRRRLVMAFVMSFCVVAIFGTMALCMRAYRRAPFACLSAFCEKMIAEYPETEQAILNVLKQQSDDSDGYDLEKEKNAFGEQSGYYSGEKDENVFGEQSNYCGKEKGGNTFLKQYGYRDEDFSQNMPLSFIVLFAAIIMLAVCGFFFLWFYLVKYNRTRIAELTDYLERINLGGADVSLLVKEDEFSHLQDELYKTVTELYHTKEQAVRTKLNYADNLANIAHQLKTPITAAFLSLSAISRFYTEMRNKFCNQVELDFMQILSQNEENAERIRNQLERLQHLEEALLTLSKIDAGVLKLEYADVDIYTVLNLAADNMNDLFQQRNISISIPEKGCVMFKGDLEWFMEAVMNLLKNCMEHSPQNGTIYCDYAANPLYAKIQIWDEGKGFEEKDIPHLFERFYRGNSYSENDYHGKSYSENGYCENTLHVTNHDTRENDTGVGMGLSLSRAIVELHNGTITAHNLPQGGACFEIKIYCH